VPSAKEFLWKTLLCSKRGSLKHAVTQPIAQAVKQALEQAINLQGAAMRTRRVSVYGTGTTTKTAGSIDRYKSISGWQSYIVS